MNSVNPAQLADFQNFLSTLSNEESVLLGTILGVIITGTVSVMLFISLFMLVLDIIANWKLFVKMGEPGWKCLIPFYRDYVLWGKVWKSSNYIIYLLLCLISFAVLSPYGTYINNKFNALSKAGNTIATNPEMSTYATISLIIAILLFIVAIVFIVFAVKLARRVSRSFGHGGWVAFFYFLLPIITTFVLAFGKSEYKGNLSDSFIKKK